MDSGRDGILHTTDSSGDPNVFNLNHNDDGLWLNDNWAKPDNKYNSNNKFAFRLGNYFLSAVLQAAVFLFRIIQILLPAAEHFSDLVEFHCHILILFIGDEFAFPRD